MRRPPLPPFIGDLVSDRAAASALLASFFALLAAGLDPKTMAPMATTTQAAIRARPELEGLVLLISVGTALALLVGGAVGDTTRARPIILGGLVVSLISAIVALPLLNTGLPFQLVRVVGIVAAAALMPVSLAMAATAYTGVARATAIGIAYAGYGLGQGISPTLVSLIPGHPGPAFLASIAGCALALFVVRNRIPELPRPTRLERPYVLGTALWAGGVVLIATSVLWFGAGPTDPLRVTLFVLGCVLVVAFVVVDRWRVGNRLSEVRIDRRPVTIALFVGLVIAVAQTVPMSQLPLYFGVAMRYGPVLGILALAPLFAGLVLAGPVAGFLLSRYQPRTLVLAGMVAVGVGDLATALLVGPGTPYLVFIVPLLLVGGGFVVATTVRTAIIFAAVPRGLPATAAALNEASLEVGTRAGMVVVTALLAQVAVAVYSSSLTGTPAQVEAAVEPFRQLLVALGTPAYKDLQNAIAPADLSPYRDAYLAGVRAAMLGAGIVALAGAALAWATLGRRNPLQAVYELREARVAEG
ncbi:MAG TPA: MFS transporter [Candidatus Limnocylindrales bacterium]|nr:MFS transporter [Candidatus Limnocylindrales bacterium]